MGSTLLARTGVRKAHMQDAGFVVVEVDELQRSAAALSQVPLLRFLCDLLHFPSQAFVSQLSELLEALLPVTVIVVMRDDCYSRFIQNEWLVSIAVFSNMMVWA
jgi:hypothetical protein